MKRAVFPIIIISASISACSDAPYEPIIDGPKTALYENDLAECRQLSLQKEKTNGGAIGGAILGGLIGATESGGDALAGAVIGGTVGSLEDGAEANDGRDAIVMRCMQGRGHKVVG